MMPPLVSIVVINYNYGRFLEECLRSVTRQTYQNLECVVLDNYSTDESRDVIADFVASYDRSPHHNVRFVCVNSDENLHLTRGCMAGFNKSNGEFVCFLDADDTLLPAFVENHVFAHLTVRKPVGVSSVDMYQSTSNGIVATTTPGLSSYVASGRGRTSNFTRELSSSDYEALLGNRRLNIVKENQLHYVPKEVSAEWVWSPTSGLCFRRDAVSLMFSHEPGLQASVDAYLLRGISSLTGSVLIDAPLAEYRHHGSNIFAKRPPLSNFNSFRRDQLAAEDREVAEAIIRCYVHNARYLASSLEYHGYFIDAVTTVAASGIAPLSTRDVDYLKSFIRSNKEELVAAFGADAVRQWDMQRRIKRFKNSKFFRLLGR